MDQNLSDINEANIQNQPKSKRKTLIVIAFGLLVAVIGLVGFVVLNQKKPMEIEVSHAELERLAKEVETPKKEDELDQIIAEIKTQIPAKQGEVEVKQEKNTEEESKEQMQAYKRGKFNNQETVHQDREERSQAPQPKIDAQGVVEPNGQKSVTVAIQSSQDQIKPKLPQKQTMPILESKKSNAQALEAESLKPKQPSKEVEKVQPKAASDKAPMSQKKPKEALKVANTGSIPQGFYLQVGVFGGKPNLVFLKKLTGFSYQVEKVQSKGKVAHRYLIGPFKTKEDAHAKSFEVSEKITKPVLVEIR